MNRFINRIENCIKEMKQTVIKYSPENKEISLERKRDEEKEKGKGKIVLEKQLR